MSDSAAPAPEEPKKSKKGLILIIAGVVGLLVLVVAVVLGTLYAAGVFDAKVDPQAQLEAGDEEHGDAKEGQEGKKEEGKKEGTNNREQNGLGFGNNILRSLPDFTIEIFEVWIIRVKWCTRAVNMASIGGHITNLKASSVNIQFDLKTARRVKTREAIRI